MSKLRSVNTHFWSDTYVLELDPTEKLLFLYLITNDQTNMLGVYEMHLRRISFDTGIDKDMVLKIFARFEKANKAKYLDGYVILQNFLKHQSFNDNMKKSAINSWNELPEMIRGCEFAEPIAKGLKGFGTLAKGLKIPPENTPKKTDSIDLQDEKGEPLPKGSEPIAEIEREIEKETETEPRLEKEKTASALDLYNKILSWIEEKEGLWKSYKSIHGVMIKDKDMISATVMQYATWCVDKGRYLDKDADFHFAKIMKWLRREKYA